MNNIGHGINDAVGCEKNNEVFRLVYYLGHRTQNNANILVQCFCLLCNHVFLSSLSSGGYCLVPNSGLNFKVSN